MNEELKANLIAQSAEKKKLHIIPTTHWDIPSDLLNTAPCYRHERFERPQVLVQNGHPTHLYVASGTNIAKGDGSCSYVFRIKE